MGQIRPDGYLLQALTSASLSRELAGGLGTWLAVRGPTTPAGRE